MFILRYRHPAIAALALVVAAGVATVLPGPLSEPAAAVGIPHASRGAQGWQSTGGPSEAQTCSSRLCDGEGGGGGGIGGGKGVPSPGIPAAWPDHPSRTGNGEVYQKPGSTRDSNSVRVMPAGADERYHNGYVVFTNDKNQPLDLSGRPGTRSATHIPRFTRNGSWPVPAHWKY